MSREYVVLPKRSLPITPVAEIWWITVLAVVKKVPWVLVRWGLISLVDDKSYIYRYK
jgi:hypothetical protein